MNSFKKAIAVVLSAVTMATTWVGAIPVFADEVSSGEMGTVYVKLTDNGSVKVNAQDEETSYRLKDNEVQSKGSNGEVATVNCDNADYDFKVEKPIGTTLDVKAVADLGYKVSEYSTTTDSGDVSEEDLSNEISTKADSVVVSEKPQYVTVSFDAISVPMDKEEELNDLDFSTCRLLVGSSVEDVLNDVSVLSTYNGVSLLQFPSEDATKRAYIALSKVADFVNVDTADFEVSDIANVEEDKMSEGINPIGELSEADTEEVSQSNVIAVIDTGSSERDNVIERVSMLGDVVSDDNGHGDEMISKILSQDKDAKVISIKAMDSNGKGTTSSVYAGLQYAIEKKVDIINMSFVGIANEDNSSIKDLIETAINQGITVVGAAGNNGTDASYFIPGCVEGAYIIGAANSDGTRLESSNYGKTVDYNVVAGSTSEASALFTGYLSKHKAIDDVNSNNFIYSTDYKVKSDDKPKEDVKPTTPKEDDSVVDTSKSVIVKYLFIDDSNLTGEETIDTVMATDTSKVLYQLQSFADVVKAKDGTYKVTTDAPFVNGSSTSKKPLDVAFAKGNDNGIEVTKGVSYNFDTNVATVSEDALVKGEDDFCNLQIQLLVPTSLSKKAKVTALVEDGTGKKLGVTTLKGTPYDESYVKIVTKDTLSKEDIKVIANGSSTNSGKYEFEDSYVKLGCLGIYKDVKIVVSGSRESAFEISEYDGPNAQKVAWLKDNTDISNLKVGNSSQIKVRLAHKGVLGTVDSKPIVDDPIPNYGSLGGGTWQFGNLAGIALPTTIKFNSKCKLNFQLYSNGVDSYGNWGKGYNHTIMGACYHVTQSYSHEEYKNATIRIISIRKDTEKPNRTYITFSVLTNNGFTGPQSVGGIYYVGVENTSIKLQMQKDSSVDGFNTPYSREGAKYNIYTDKACTKPFKFGGKDAYITIDSNGYGKLGEGSGVNNDSNDKNTRFWYQNSGADIKKGTYYAKEDTAPKSGKYTKGSDFQKKEDGYYEFVSVGKKDSKNIPIYRAHYITKKGGKDAGTPIDDPLVNLQLNKISANPELTKGNSCYSYKGAVYGIYWLRSDATNGKNCRGYITTDKDGYGAYFAEGSKGYGTNSKDTSAVYKNKNSGTPVRAVKSRDKNKFTGWYVKELTAPKGYTVDNTVYQLTDSGKVTSEGLKIYRPNGKSNGIADEPANDPFIIRIQKRNAITGETKRLENAVFKLEYYAEYLDFTKYDKNFQVDSSDPNAKIPKFTASKPTRTWYIKTDEFGRAYLDDGTKYVLRNNKDYPDFNSDETYKDKDTGDVVVPYGTLKVTEVKAPEKYDVTPVIYYRTLDNNGTDIISQVELPVDENPKVEMDTVALDTDTKSHNGFTSAKTCVSDTITYSNLTGGREYTVKGMLIKKSDKSKIPLLNEDGTILKDSKGKQATEKSVTMIANANGSGHYSINYYFNSNGLEKDSVVAYAFIYDKATGELLGSHEDLTDADQTVSFRGRELSMITVATDDATDSAISYIPDDGWGYISDKVSYVGLDKNRSYRLKTEIYEIENGKVSDTPVKINTSGMTFETAIYTVFQPTSDSGTVNVSNIRFGLPEGKVDLTTRKFVVYETLTYSDGSSIMKNGKVDPGSIHKDPTDTNQIVTYSDLPIDTVAKVANASGDGKVGYISGRLSQTMIEETVTLENLNATDEYQLSPYLVLKSTGKVLDKAKVYLVDAKGKKTLITKGADGDTFVPNGGGWGNDNGRFKFTALAKTQMIKLAFDVSAYKDTLAGEEVVVCEEVGGMQLVDGDEYYNTYSEHDDLDDADQTVKFLSSTIKTTASMESTKTKYAYALGNDTVKDTVSLTGLIPGETYNLQGYVVDKASKQILAQGDKTFKADTDNDTVSMELGIDVSSLAGKDLVVYEDLYYTGSLIASHSDINDADQTVTILNPTIKTSASASRSSVYRDRVVLEQSSDIYDTVSMTGLIPGETYTVEGQVIEKSSEEPVALKGTSAKTGGTNLVVTLSEDKLSATTTFTAVGESQDVVFHYIIDSTYYAGKSVVVVEDLYYSDDLIATHRDLTDTDQTLTYKSEGSLKITKVDSNTGEVVKDSATFNLYKVNADGTETLVNNHFSSIVSQQLGTYVYRYDESSSYSTDLLTYPERHHGMLVDPNDVGTMSIAGLPSGKYKLREIKAPENYIISNQEGIDVEIVNGEVTEATVENTPRLTSFSFIKTDDNADVEKSKVLAGAGFTLYKDEACEVQAKDFYMNVMPEVLTGENGMVDFNNIGYSDKTITKYYIKETTTPIGYVPLDYVIEVSIDTEGTVSFSRLNTDGTSAEISDSYRIYVDEDKKFYVDFTRIINHRGSVILNKKDENGDNLAGSEWELHKVTKAVADDGTVSYTSDEVVSVDATKAQGTYRAEDLKKGTSTLKTSDKGTLSIGNLPLGDYYLVETKAPENKMPYGEKIEFSLTADKPDIGLTDDGITVIDNKPFLPKTGSFGDMGIYWIGLVSLLISLSIFALAFARAKKIKNILKRG
jgi:LPXTG-motif cell wall-anchored protein